ncbi:hypothetical protein CGG80_24095 [Vibrio parahaemolyticus]|uniref:helix-turn-helix domain-containing protein n=2 Tax=Vibrio parahaemolyticus TaxID=670 RepID=UPI00111D79D1|nr:helix-turn-helix domain-containing protein [Vibrio parahaemolyticus]EGQ7859381.1 helix-turn-helix domain-containing protein [Vibrio parahaemolyticus]MDF4871523.1 helix-turn-helix domain-containing protein [Vibrio parahaemolyticus]TOF18348.1 hypothetical protein CGJ26_23470 [Vibrio parahaemolyticus]TOR11275.1 hypothetical protein CGG80_24095 [Vibrio parahaemolyticus]
MADRALNSIKEIRKALRMSSKQLAVKLGKAPSTVSELENREITGNITIQSLKEIAECLDCELHYEFKPKVPVDEQVLNQAIREVKNELGENLNLYREDDIERDARELLKESTILNW